MVFHRRNVRLHLSLSRLIAVPAVAIALISALAATGSPALAAPAHPAVAAQSCEYVVQPGDWLSRIAARYRVSWHYLAQINHLANPNLIYVGERLSVCGGTSVPPPAAPPKATPPPLPANLAVLRIPTGLVNHAIRAIMSTVRSTCGRCRLVAMRVFIGSMRAIMLLVQGSAGATGGQKCCIPKSHASSGARATAAPSLVPWSFLRRVSRELALADITAKSSLSLAATGFSSRR